jgi:hypothetical protein
MFSMSIKKPLSFFVLLSFIAVCVSQSQSLEPNICSECDALSQACANDNDCVILKTYLTYFNMMTCVEDYTTTITGFESYMRFVFQPCSGSVSDEFLSCISNISLNANCVEFANVFGQQSTTVGACSLSSAAFACTNCTTEQMDCELDSTCFYALQVNPFEGDEDFYAPMCSSSCSFQEAIDAAGQAGQMYAGCLSDNQCLEFSTTNTECRCHCNFIPCINDPACVRIMTSLSPDLNNDACDPGSSSGSGSGSSSSSSDDNDYSGFMLYDDIYRICKEVGDCSVFHEFIIDCQSGPLCQNCDSAWDCQMQPKLWDCVMNEGCWIPMNATVFGYMYDCEVNEIYCSASSMDDHRYNEYCSPSAGAADCSNAAFNELYDMFNHLYSNYSSSDDDCVYRNCAAEMDACTTERCRRDLYAITKIEDKFDPEDDTMFKRFKEFYCMYNPNGMGECDPQVNILFNCWADSCGNFTNASKECVEHSCSSQVNNCLMYKECGQPLLDFLEKEQQCDDRITDNIDEYCCRNQTCDEILAITGGGNYYYVEPTSMPTLTPSTSTTTTYMCSNYDNNDDDDDDDYDRYHHCNASEYKRCADDCRQCKDDAFNDIVSGCDDGSCTSEMGSLFGCIFENCPDDGDEENDCPQCSMYMADCVFGGDGCYTDIMFISENLFGSIFDNDTNSTNNTSVWNWVYPAGDNCTQEYVISVITEHNVTEDADHILQIVLDTVMTCMYSQIISYCEDTGPGGHNADGICGRSVWLIYNCMFEQCLNVSLPNMRSLAPTEDPTVGPTDEPTDGPTNEPTPSLSENPTPSPSENPTTFKPTAEPTTEPSPAPTRSCMDRCQIFGTGDNTLPAHAPLESVFHYCCTNDEQTATEISLNDGMLSTCQAQLQWDECIPIDACSAFCDCELYGPGSHAVQCVAAVQQCLRMEADCTAARAEGLTILPGTADNSCVCLLEACDEPSRNMILAKFSFPVCSADAVVITEENIGIAGVDTPITNANHDRIIRAHCYRWVVLVIASLYFAIAL